MLISISAASPAWAQPAPAPPALDPATKAQVEWLAVNSVLQTYVESFNRLIIEYNQLKSERDKLKSEIGALKAASGKK